MSLPSFDPMRVLGALASQEIGVCIGEGTRLVSVNDAFERISGCTRDALLHGAVDAALLLPTEWHGEDDTAARFAHRHGYSRPYLRQLRRPDGSQVDIIIINAIAATSPLCWVCCVVDVSALAHDLGTAARASLGLPPRERRGLDATSRIVAESPTVAAPVAATMPALRPMLAAVLDGSPTGALLLNASAEAVHATPAACTVLGQSMAQLVGLRWRDLVHPADLTLLDARLLVLLGGQRADAVPPLTMRWRHARGVWHEIDVQPVLIPDAPDCLAVLHLHDRTPVLLAERSAQQSDAVRRAVIAQAPGHAVVHFDLALRCISAEGEGLETLCAAAGVPEAGQLSRAWGLRLGTVREGYDDAWTVMAPDVPTLYCTGTAMRDSRGVMTGVLLVARMDSTAPRG